MSLTFLTIDFTRLNTTARKAKALKTQEEMQVIINSENFKQKVLAMNYHGETSHWKRASAREIYEVIMAGTETLVDEEDKIISIILDDYWTLRGVIGYTYPDSATVFVNTRYYDKRESKLVGSNILHEYFHTLGGSHDSTRTPERPYSICYQLNRVYEQCHNEIFGDQRVHVIYTPWYRRALRWLF